jgi:hypothetical protein
LCNWLIFAQLEEVTLQDLGRCKNIEISQDDTLILDGAPPFFFFFFACLCVVCVGNTRRVDDDSPFKQLSLSEFIDAEQLRRYSEPLFVPLCLLCCVGLFWSVLIVQSPPTHRLWEPQGFTLQFSVLSTSFTNAPFLSSLQDIQERCDAIRSAMELTKVREMREFPRELTQECNRASTRRRSCRSAWPSCRVIVCLLL